MPPTKAPTATPATVHKQIDEYRAIADGALALDLIPEDGEQLFFYRKLLERYGPPLVQALDELQKYDCAERPKSKTLLYCLMRALNAAYGIGALACRSESGDDFVRREITNAARKAPKNSERQRAVNKAFDAAVAGWDGRHPAKKAEEIAADLARQGINKPKARAIYDRLKKLAVSGKDCNSDA